MWRQEPRLREKPSGRWPSGSCGKCRWVNTLAVAASPLASAESFQPKPELVSSTERHLHGKESGRPHPEQHTPNSNQEDASSSVGVPKNPCKGAMNLSEWRIMETRLSALNTTGRCCAPRESSCPSFLLVGSGAGGTVRQEKMWTGPAVLRREKPRCLQRGRQEVRTPAPVPGFSHPPS